MNFKFFHVFANGSDASNFIISEQDFVFKFNLIGVCAYCSKVKVAAALCTLSNLDYKTRQALCGRRQLPDHWIICNNLILTNNYIDVSLFENIFQTYDCFRVFTGA